LQNSDFLARKLSHLNYAAFGYLSPVALANLVASFPGIDHAVAARIIDEEVDGAAFLMLTQKGSYQTELPKKSAGCQLWI
jgi:hypothetical protein